MHCGMGFRIGTRKLSEYVIIRGSAVYTLSRGIVVVGVICHERAAVQTGRQYEWDGINPLHDSSSFGLRWSIRAGEKLIGKISIQIDTVRIWTGFPLVVRQSCGHFITIRVHTGHNMDSCHVHDLGNPWVHTVIFAQVLY